MISDHSLPMRRAFFLSDYCARINWLGYLFAGIVSANSCLFLTAVGVSTGSNPCKTGTCPWELYRQSSWPGIPASAFPWARKRHDRHHPYFRRCMNGYSCSCNRMRSALQSWSRVCCPDPRSRAVPKPLAGHSFWPRFPFAFEEPHPLVLGNGLLHTAIRQFKWRRCVTGFRRGHEENHNYQKQSYQLHSYFL
jgi:hypothetical protein